MAAPDLTKREMEAVLLEHEIAELEEDIDRTMATLSPNPHYELATLGLAFDGHEAVRMAYSRILPGNRHRNVAAEMRIHAVAANTLVREAHVSFTKDDGERVTGQYLVVMSFDPETKLISGERMYMDPNFADMFMRSPETKLISGERMYMDPNFADMFRANLGPDFESMPGVVKLSDSAPMIDRHDAYAVAERRGLTIN